MNSAIAVCTRHTVGFTGNTVQAVYTGNIEPAGIAAMVREAAALAEAKSTKLVLFDIRHVMHGGDAGNAGDQLQIIRNNGLTPEHRIAIVSAVRDQCVAEMETVAADAGYNVRVFTKICTATAWLQQTPRRNQRVRRLYHVTRF